VVLRGGIGLLVWSSFSDNSLFLYTLGASIVEAAADLEEYGDCAVVLEGCTLSNNNVLDLPMLLDDNRGAVTIKGLFYSDQPDPAVCSYDGPGGRSIPPECQTSTPQPLQDAPIASNASSPWFVQVQQIRPPRSLVLYAH
jgi:hypothetical protein